MKPEDDLELLWTKAKSHGLTYKRAAGLLEKKWLGKWGISTVRDAVQGRGADARENQLRVTLQEFLEKAESAIDGPAESVKARVAFDEDKVEYLTSEEWKQQAKAVKRENDLLRMVICLIAAPKRPLNSKLPAELEEILTWAENLRDDQHGKP